MADRQNDQRAREHQRAPGADEGREGFGDDGGTRIGRPDAGRSADAGKGPSTQPVKEGLEGAVFEDDDTSASRGPRTANTGAGGEAAEGVHNAQGSRSPGDRSGVDDADSGTRGGAGRRGSEPLEDREGQHTSGYGGAGGAPKSSSDQRE